MLRQSLFVVSLTIFLTSASLGQGNTITTATTPAATASVTTSAKKPPIFRPTKDQIKEVQTILKNKKLYAGEASGTYTDETRTSIKSFQKDNGLKETGTLNRATLEKFGVALTDKQKEIPVSPNSFATADSSKTSTRSSASSSSTTASSNGSTSNTPKRSIFRATADQITAAQKLLKSKSMYAGEETGKLDDATCDGLKKYQETNGIKVTGTLNAVTLTKMGIALTDKQKADAAATTPAPATTPKN
jgi:peptidoglycan hydrolase-like protein with peptidoglycan-binding domain